MTKRSQLVWLLTHRGHTTGTWTPWGPPLGQPALGDVPVLEPEGGYEWAVTVVVPQGENLAIYRRLFGPRFATADPPAEPAEAQP